MPAPLPPEIRWTSELVAALSKADRAVGRLAGEGGRLPNPHLLIRPFLRREAVLSSRIEGTQATLGELLASEAGAAVERSPEDLREVGNYVAALEHGLGRLRSGGITLRLIRELHARLMKGVRGGEALPGRLRNVQNWIGAPGSSPARASYVPPPPGEIGRCLAQWLAFQRDRALPPLVHVALAHYQFEAIHPFLDGNGRVGRLLIALELMHRSVLSSPLLYLSAWFEATRLEYYASLSVVTERGAWETWLYYFLTGVSRQAVDVLSRAERINSILAGWRRKLRGSTSLTLHLLLDLLSSNPFLIVPRAASSLGVSFSTVQRCVDRLERANVVEQTSRGRRDRVYCALDILEVLEEPASLTQPESS